MSRRTAGLATLVVLTVAAVFLPVLSNGFVDYDDELYLTGNPAIAGGLNPAAVRWAMGATHAANWHPLTWLSHLLDVTLFGFEPRGHHLTGLLIHAVAAGLLFLAMEGMTGAWKASLIVALLFGLHPLRVESVAWAAERKDVLAAFCWVATLLIYRRYLARPSAWRLAAVAGGMALGLLAKPMGVTIPFALLLLDWWPLGRIGSPEGGKWSGTLREKIPLILLSIASAAVTFVVQRRWGAVRTFDVYPLAARLENAVVAIVRYLGLMAWPADLAIWYPHPRGGIPAGLVAAAALLATAITFWAVWWRRRAPSLASGWFWYLGTLAPVLGIVQVGGQAMADRYTYIPSIGIAMAVCFGFTAVAGRFRVPAPAVAVAVLTLLAALSVATIRQIGHWRDNIALFEHAVAVTRDNWQAHINLATSLAKAGRFDEAAAHFAEVERLRPRYADSHRLASPGLPSGMPGMEGGVDLMTARLLAAQGRIDEAASRYEAVLAARPALNEARRELADLLIRGDRPGDALRHYDILIAGGADDRQVHNNRGVALVSLGREGEAIGAFRRSVAADPGSVDARINLAKALVAAGQMEEGMNELQDVLAADPGNARARWLLDDAGRRRVQARP